MTRMRVRRSLIDVAVCLAIPAVLVTVALVRPPTVYTVEPLVPSCVEQREIRYCVHQDNESRLDDLVGIVDPYIARFGTKPSNVDEIWDEALIPPPGDSVPGRETAGLEPDGGIWTDVTSTLGGNFTCNWEGEYDDRMSRIAALESDVTFYLETGEPSGSLASMTVGEVQERLAVHQKQLHTCTLTVDQLPGASVR